MTQPEMRFKAGGLTAAVFLNQIQTPDGVKPVKNVVLERTYRDKEGKYQTSNSLSVNDIPKAILVLQKAFDYIASRPVEPSSVLNKPQHLSGEPST